MNELQGCAVGLDGQVVRTGDGGETWTTNYLSVGGYLLSIAFSSPQNGCIGGWDGLCYHTHDGGVTWETSESDSWVDIYEITFTSDVRGWAAGINYWEESTGLLETSDGGETWTSVATDFFANLNTIDFSDPLHGSCLGWSGRGLITSDGGATWTGIVVDSTSTIYGIAETGGRCWAVGASGLLLRSDDRWQSTESMTSGRSDHLRDVCFLDTQRGWAVGQENTTEDLGVILQTEDGGVTWTRRTTANNEALTSICFVDELNGWISGTAAALHRTHDGGVTWSAVAVSPLDNYYDMEWRAAGETDLGWLVGASYGLGRITRTTDGGATWSAQTITGASALNAVRFVSDACGWAAGDAGSLLRTNDGGETWERLTFEYDKYINDLHFFDEARGWLICYDYDASYLLRTSDGGQSWETVFTTTETTLRSLTVRDSEAWITGYAGMIFHSVDAGEHWETAETPCSAGLEGLAACGDQVWAVGANGTILHYDGSGDSLPPRALPFEISLSAYPNPFNPATRIAFHLTQSGPAALKVYNLLGQEIAALLDGYFTAGNHTVLFDGSGLASGHYLCTLQSGGHFTTHKIVLIR